ncbi:hypothetical protein COO60DRAFT_1636916 [Scenedesmus sp. NREL 46B-D3]|nr:hypothetical protein COO60DRAFT_1636916 [Scenedesmus sp. NREL 46B-D3]
MTTESPATKRARLQGDSDVSTAVAAVAAVAGQAATAKAPAAAIGDASVADAAAAPSRRRRRTPSPRQAAQKANQEQPAATAAVEVAVAPTYQLVMGIHQCIKRDLPHEALHLYSKIKQLEPDRKVDTSVHSALLGLLVGKWQWELHQRHQHLLRQYQQDGRDAAALDAAAAAIVAATVQQRQQQQDADNNILEKMAMPAAAGDDALPPGLVCHMEVQVELLREDRLKDRAWLDGLLEGMSADRQPLLQLLQHAVPLLLADLEAQEQALDEQLYLQLARVAGIMGEPDKAFDYAKQLVSRYQAGGAAAARLAPRLRDFQPALVGYALTGQAARAGEVIDLALQHCSQDLTEPEFALWLEAIANGGSYQQLADALTAMAGELNAVRSSTLQLVERFFRSDRAAAALAAGGPLAALGKSSWQLQWVTPDEQGKVEEAGGVSLQMLDLSESDWEAFGVQVKQLAEQQEKQAGKFQVFSDWLDRNGPYDIMIDGANVALPDKIRVMYEAVQQQSPDAKVLLVLHSGRYNDARLNHAEAFQWMERLRKASRFYVTPGGSNDDWYWMYAAVQARERGLLVSNDQLRDHVWNLLRPKHMLKWTQRHIIRFVFNFHKTQAFLRHPLPYTPCAQQFPQQGVWLLPEAREGTGAEEEGEQAEDQQQQQQQLQQQLRWLCCKAV